ncbi:hypothetical protein MPC4_10472 [Methylocella tundrae]|uniref:Uncharacterized protein n=1 Tax=Methylocella tundrae TaxID=227605 RepID=A0A8B6M0E8_METTU|nr:hypothetical protein MPC4_10472 [Methylocella tundrae]
MGFRPSHPAPERFPIEWNHSINQKSLQLASIRSGTKRLGEDGLKTRFAIVLARGLCCAVLVRMSGSPQL